MYLCRIYLWQHKDFLMASFVAIFYTLPPAQPNPKPKPFHKHTPKRVCVRGCIFEDEAFDMAPQPH